MKLKYLLIIIVSFQILGCSTLHSSFRPADITGGYGEEKISDDVYMVFFDGNGFTPADVAKKYFLRRSAQVALKMDRDCFVILNEKGTLSLNYATSNKTAVKSKYYSAVDNSGAPDSNKADENSVSGLVQIYKQSSAPSDCIDANITLQSTNL